MIITIAIAVIPTIVLCYFVYKKDILEKEPIDLLIKLFSLGIASTIPAAFLEEIAMIFIDTNDTSYINIFIMSFFCIALIEEGYKALFTYLLSWKDKNFNHIYDGIVYSVFTSLGFATLENILYVLSYGTGVGLLRAIVSVPGHAFFGVAMGYYMGFAKYNEKKNERAQLTKNLALSIIMPIIFHGLFDFLLLIGNSVMILVFFVFVLILYILSYLKIKKLSKVMSLIEDQ